MTIEVPHPEPPKEYEPHLIQLGIPFKPFEEMTGFYITTTEDLERRNIIPETYDAPLIMRREVEFFGTRGYIDVIGEDLAAPFAIALHPEYVHETPMGLALFNITLNVDKETGKAKGPIHDQPCIMRFSFFPKTPREYTRILETLTHVRLGETDFVLPWTLQQKRQRKAFKRLENRDGEVKIMEKNLFPDASIDELDFPSDLEEEQGEVEDIDFGRVSFVWLPEDLEKLKTIEVVFTDYGDDNNYFDEPQPQEPTQKDVPVLV